MLIKIPRPARPIGSGKVNLRVDGHLLQTQECNRDQRAPRKCTKKKLTAHARPPMKKMRKRLAVNTLNVPRGRYKRIRPRSHLCRPSANLIPTLLGPCPFSGAFHEPPPH